MTRNWTFGQKIGAGFALTAALAFAIGTVAVVALRTVVTSKDKVILTNAHALSGAQELATAAALKANAFRGFLLTKEERDVEAMLRWRADFTSILGRLRAAVETPESKRLLDEVERREAEHQAAADQLIALRRTEANAEAVSRAFDETVQPRYQAMAETLASFVVREEAVLREAMQASTRTASSAIGLVLLIAVVLGAVAVLSAFILARTLGRQVGLAVGQVQSSSAELQAAASQQASGAREQATAMNEITTTISELLATSRQIAESAQRVAHIAEDTARSARTGEGTVEKAHESIAAIRKQVDLVVSHMLDLGKKSQQIGAVLDIVSELAEQTNILAINATIEAAGAGEAGRRFTVVADEIRKLADRVAVSTKEIRGLIEDVRGAVNTTVMATEGGSKAVDAGSRQFAEVAANFKQIAALVSTTTEAAREIELSTKQQATAVEQVNIAVSNVAQTTKETESSSSQTQQTASQLAGLSKELLRLVQSRATVHA